MTDFNKSNSDVQIAASTYNRGLLVCSTLESLHSVMFYLVCLVPLCVAAVQVLAWRPFSIRNSHTVDTKYIDS